MYLAVRKSVMYPSRLAEQAYLQMLLNSLGCDSLSFPYYWVQYWLLWCYQRCSGFQGGIRSVDNTRFIAGYSTVCF